MKTSIESFYKVGVDKDKCIGCGACASVCDNFQLADGKAKPVKTIVKMAGCNTEAEKICPVGAISVRRGER